MSLAGGCPENWPYLARLLREGAGRDEEGEQRSGYGYLDGQYLEDMRCPYCGSEGCVREAAPYLYVCDRCDAEWDM